jgi:hypothetical protein
MLREKKAYTEIPFASCEKKKHILIFYFPCFGRKKHILIFYFPYCGRKKYARGWYFISCKMEKDIKKWFPKRLGGEKQGGGEVVAGFAGRKARGGGSGEKGGTDGEGRRM